MRTALVLPEAGFNHGVPPGHPESIGRLRTVAARLNEEAFAHLPRLTPRPATAAEVARVHPGNYLDHLKDMVVGPGEIVMIDPDTALSVGSLAAALEAAGSAMSAVDAVLGGEAEAVFVAARPPGHHAEPARPMGFCLINSVAVAAAHARHACGVERVAILDFDVHHGNGTQAFATDQDWLFFASSHQEDAFPLTGRADERGAFDNIHNVPLAAGTGGAGFRAAWRDHLLPSVRAFDPQLILISAGFDAHRADPLASMMLETGDYHWITTQIAELARANGAPALVSLLEGGYDLEALSDSVAAHVAALMEA